MTVLPMNIFQLFGSYYIRNNDEKKHYKYTATIFPVYLFCALLSDLYIVNDKMRVWKNSNNN